MPRANRYMIDGLTYHITHRCLNQEFLLKFEKDRNEYLKWLADGVARFEVPILSYSLMSNHVHLIAQARSTAAIADLMHLAAGSTARGFNRRKGRSGSFWDDQYKCTAIENGRHLLNCIAYIHLNAVRAGIVNHPRDWPWNSHSEFIDNRKRKKIIDMEALLQSLDGPNIEDFKESYENLLNEKCAKTHLLREPEWTESLAVGSKNFIENLKNRYETRLHLEIVQVSGASGEPAWTVREATTPYSAEQ